MQFVWPHEGLSSQNTRNSIRQIVLESIASAQSGHPGGSLSEVEIISSLFESHFFHKASDPFMADRDRFVLSKGHGCPTLYAVLSYLQYFSPMEMKNLRKLGHFLQGHPDKSQYPLMEASTGSLGQGVSVALGLALALQSRFESGELKRLPNVFCLVGDGEMQEGQVWECLMASAKFRPSNLVFILDFNRGQIDGPVSEVMNLEPLPSKIESFGLDPLVVDGHDVKALNKLWGEILNSKNRKNVPFVIAQTVKGKGVSFMEGQNKWHGSAPSREQLDAALKEIWSPGPVAPNGRLLNS
jgi:transketolase